MEEKRIRASALLFAGLKKKHISQMLDISLSTVKRVEKRMKNKESLKDRPRSGRPRAIDPAIVKTAFLKNPTMKMSELAKKKKISKLTISRADRSQSGKSLKRLKKPLLTNGMIFKQKTRCKKLLNDIKSCGNRIIFFSDEKTFTVDPVINKQNDRVVSFGQDISSHLHSSTTKHPASLMMLFNLMKSAINSK